MFSTALQQVVLLCAQQRLGDLRGLPACPQGACNGRMPSCSVALTATTRCTVAARRMRPSRTFITGPRTSFVTANGPTDADQLDHTANGVNIAMSFDLSSTVHSFVGCDAHRQCPNNHQLGTVAELQPQGHRRLHGRGIVPGTQATFGATSASATTSPGSTTRPSSQLHPRQRGDRHRPAVHRAIISS